MILVYLIISIAGIFALGWLFRWTGQKINWPKDEWNIYFRDMSYLVGVGFIFAVALILFTLYVYFILQIKFFVWGVQLLVICGLSGYIFRFLGRRIGTEGSRKLFRSMPVTAAFGILTVILYALLAIFADFIAPYEQDEIFEVINALPGGNPDLGGDPRFLLGTDQLGRDLLSRLIYGAQNTVGIAFATTVFSFLIGITGGFLAATLGGWVDQALSRAVDALMAIPQLIFALLLMTIATAWAGSNKVMIMVYMVLIIAVLDSTRVYRLSRAVGLNIVVMDFIEAAKVRGETLRYLLFREILPNAMAPLLAEFGLRFCFVFLTISALSFLGIGIQPPLADWGTMVRDLAQFINFAAFSPLTATLPLLAAGAIALLTVAVNFIVDWVLHKSSGLKS
ncbi:MAG: ABC transporter permease [Paracoccaceae bacterium]|nr:ABC transporter permease [Paracoccaceae bacterium]